MRRVIAALLIASTTIYAQQVINPNNPLAEKKVDAFREPLPSPEVRTIKLDSPVKIINTKGNYWTVIQLPFKKFDYLVGNSSYYEVVRKGDKLLVRPKKAYVNSDITIIVDGKIYKLLLSQSRQLPDLIVKVGLPKPVDYEAEVVKFLQGTPPAELKHIRIEPFKEGKHYDRVVFYKNQKWGIRYVR